MCVSTLGVPQRALGFRPAQPKACGCCRGAFWVPQTRTWRAGTFFNTPSAREVLSPLVLIDIKTVAQRCRGTCPRSPEQWSGGLQVALPLRCCVGTEWVAGSCDTSCICRVFTAQGYPDEQTSGAEIQPMLCPLGASWPGPYPPEEGVPSANSHQGTPWALLPHPWLPALTQTLSFKRNGAPGLPAVGAAAAAASRGLGPVATPALPPSPVPATCPPVLVRRAPAPAEGAAYTLDLVPWECGRVSLV